MRDLVIFGLILSSAGTSEARDIIRLGGLVLELANPPSRLHHRVFSGRRLFPEVERGLGDVAYPLDPRPSEILIVGSQANGSFDRPGRRAGSLINGRASSRQIDDAVRAIALGVDARTAAREIRRAPGNDGPDLDVVLLYGSREAAGRVSGIDRARHEATRLGGDLGMIVDIKPTHELLPGLLYRLHDGHWYDAKPE